MRHLLIALIFACNSAFAGEREIVIDWCTHGQVEVRNTDGTYTDCLTGSFAIEVDYAYKWYEAIGQALHYSVVTGKGPGVILIVRRETDYKYYFRLQNVLNKFGLKVPVWIVLE